MEKFTGENIPAPTPAQQAQNLIRFIGDHVQQTGGNLTNFPEGLYAIIGAPNPAMAGQLAAELYRRGLVEGHLRQPINTPTDILNANLTLDGWEGYDAEMRGMFAGKTAFIALPFDDPVLEQLLRDVVKPCIKDELDYDLVDMRDVARAGIIDNIMRAQIRDAAFILVELTHDNPGAYWEAGYAEGLGKPVIYLCEKTKFDTSKTHFDTNHCTTVAWTRDDADQFRRELIATIRRSLNLFPTA